MEGIKRKTQMKNKFLKSLVASFAMTVSGIVNAGIIVLDFEGVGDNASVNDFYNGGTDSLGNSGIDYGVEFSSNSLGLIDSDAGGNGNFANEPSESTVLFFTNGSAIMNYLSGFDTGFSFFYSSAFDATINIYDDLNATGNLLGQLTITANSSDNNCTGDPNGTYCNWTNIGMSFSGLAKSVDFGGTVNRVAYDNITFGSSEAQLESTPVPEPSTLAVFTLGLMGLASRKFKKQA